MRSHQKWWFLSEADEEEPGTDRDIDYYYYKAKDYEEAYPPPEGWVACRKASVDPPPLMEAQGVLVAPGAEFDTLEHQLVKWAIEHREVVSRSTVLIKFLAAICYRVSKEGRKYHS